MKRVILASGSPRRKELLSQIIKKFDVIPSSYEEDMTLPKSPEELALHLSWGKAEDIAEKFPNAIILAADTFVAVGSEVLGKPASLEDAKKMLQKESGKEQKVITGLAIIDTAIKRIAQDVVVTKVLMKELSDVQISEYVTTHEVLDKSGAYAIQEIGDTFVEKIDGSFTNIMGLPVERVKELLKEFGIGVS